MNILLPERSDVIAFTEIFFCTVLWNIRHHFHLVQTTKIVTRGLETESYIKGVINNDDMYPLLAKTSE